MAAKDWPAAEAIFKKLWAEHATYDVASSLGQVEFREQKYRDAAEHFAFAVANYPPREKTENLERTKQFLNAAAKHVGKLHITVDRPGAEVRIDDEPIGTSPLPPDTYVEVGSHTVEARIADHTPAHQNITIAAGATQNVELKFTGAALISGIESPAAPPVASGLEGPGAPAVPVNPKSQDSSPGAIEPRTVVLWSGVGVTVAAATLGTIFAFKSSAAKSDADAHARQVGTGGCVAGTASAEACSALEHSLNDRNSASRVANASFAVSGVAALATVGIFFLWPSRHSERTASYSVSPVLSPALNGIDFHAEF